MNDSNARILANGHPQSVALPCTLGQFLAASGWKPSQVVVELNGEVLPREQASTRLLADGDRLEVIVPVAGG